MGRTGILLLAGAGSELDRGEVALFLIFDRVAWIIVMERSTADNGAFYCWRFDSYGFQLRPS